MASEKFFLSKMNSINQFRLLMLNHAHMVQPIIRYHHNWQPIHQGLSEDLQCITKDHDTIIINYNKITLNCKIKTIPLVAFVSFDCQQ